jgi:hypothetical protein
MDGLEAIMSLVSVVLAWRMEAPQLNRSEVQWHSRSLENQTSIHRSYMAPFQSDTLGIVSRRFERLLCCGSF